MGIESRRGSTSFRWLRVRADICEVASIIMRSVVFGGFSMDDVTKFSRWMNGDVRTNVWVRTAVTNPCATWVQLCGCMYPVKRSQDEIPRMNYRTTGMNLFLKSAISRKLPKCPVNLILYLCYISDQWESRGSSERFVREQLPRG